MEINRKIQEIQVYDPSLNMRGDSGEKFDVIFQIPDHGFLLPMTFYKSLLLVYSIRETVDLTDFKVTL